MKCQRGGLSESSTTSDNTSQFIDIVKKHDVVYNTRHADYKNVEVKMKVWTKIAGEMGLSVDASKRKWKNLRDSYTKYLRSLRVGTKTSKKYQYWAHAEHMEFLKPYQGPGRSHTAVQRHNDDDEHECDLGYQVLAKATTGPEDDTEMQPILPTIINKIGGNINGNGMGNLSTISMSNTALPFISGATTSSGTCITPHLPQNNSTTSSPSSSSAALGLNNQNNAHPSAASTAALSNNVMLPVPSLPTVQLPPSLIAMPIIGAISKNNNNNNNKNNGNGNIATTTNTSLNIHNPSSAVNAATVNGLTINHHMHGGNLSAAYTNKMTVAAATAAAAAAAAAASPSTSASIPTTSAAARIRSNQSANNMIGCVRIEPQISSTDQFKKQSTNKANNGGTFLTTANALNQYAQQLQGYNGAITCSTTGQVIPAKTGRFNSTSITKIRRVQPSPQTSAINLSFSTLNNTAGGNNNNNNNVNNNNNNSNNNSNNANNLNNQNANIDYYNRASAAVAALTSTANANANANANATVTVTGTGSGTATGTATVTGNGNGNGTATAVGNGIGDIRRIQLSPQSSINNNSNFSTFANALNTTGNGNNYRNNNGNITTTNDYYGKGTAMPAVNIGGVSDGPGTPAAQIVTGPMPAKIRRINDNDVTPILQANRDLDVNTLFFLSLAKQVRAMPMKFQSLAKMRCMRIVSDIELELDNVMNGDGIATSYAYINGTTKYCNLDSPTPPSHHQQQMSLNNNQNHNINPNNNSIITEGQQPEHFVYVMSPSRVESMIDLSSDEENNINGN